MPALSSRHWRVAGINFEHFHMGDLLRMVAEHPQAEIVGIWDAEPARMRWAIDDLAISRERVFADWQECLEKGRPDLVILCPAAAGHGEWTEKVAPSGAHLLLEKPFAASLEEADRMLAAVGEGQRLAINWPLAWYPVHVTAKRLLDEGRIGELREVHFYDGNRGPLWHVAGKEETTAEWVEAEKARSWFYRSDRGGGSLLDYLGYGTTLGTWYQGGRAPVEVTCTTWGAPGLEVDEHSVTVALYEHGLSKFETRWGTFSDPWTHQPQPKCGFVLTGTEGTLASYDHESTLRLQSGKHPEGEEIPVDELRPPHRNPVEYVLHCIEHDREIEGPLSPEISRIGQQIVDTAFRSAQQKRTMPLLP